MKENILGLEYLRIKGVKNDIDVYKGYIEKKELKEFIERNDLQVTIENFNIGAFYDDKEKYRVFCLPVLNSPFICVYVVPFPPKNENGSDERIFVVNNLMSRAKKIKEYYKMMKYDF